MTRRCRVCLASLFTIWVGTVLACTGASERKGGAGSDPKVDVAGTNKQEISNTAGAAKAEKNSKARAKAEAEAEAKNEENRKAHEAEVDSLKAAHEKKMETYRAEKEAFDKAIRVYQTSSEAIRIEADAIRKLKVARIFDNPVEKEIAQRKYREVISNYPGSLAAKDAQRLLNGEVVNEREAPARPIAPVLPVEPRLVLPAAPETVAVVYPPEPEETVTAPLTKQSEITPPQGNEIASAPLIKEAEIPDRDFKDARTAEYQTPIRLTNGKTVYVRGHFSNGHYVAAHMRAAPGTATKGSSGGKRK